MGASYRCACGHVSDTPFPGGTSCCGCGAEFPSWFDAPTVSHASAPSSPVRPSVPGYEILGELGRGGMGVVYRARQTELSRDVALKMILSGAHAGPKERDRFRREAAAVAALQHPHIVQIFEIGDHNGQPYLALELVAGGTLADRLLGNPWDPAPAAELVETLARTVQHAHDRGIVHRDLKPANILMSAERGAGSAELENASGSVVELLPLRSAIPGPRSALLPKVSDFGLAKRVGESDDGGPRTGTGAVIGTPSYIAPEQAAATRVVGAAADVYSLGAILYELLTGRPPFHGGSPVETVMQVLHDDPVPPSRLRTKVPRDLETVCLKCLSKPPGRRYASATALADDLRRFLAGQPVQARPVSAAVRFAKWARRHPALAVLGGTTTVAAAAVVAVLGVAYVEVREAVRQKEAEAERAEERRIDADAQRVIAEREQQRSRELAAANDAARVAAEEQARAIADQAEASVRSIYALQLSQVAALVERNPARALALLEDAAHCPERLREFTWHHLRRLCDREQQRYDDHRDGLTAAAVSIDARLVATADRDGTVRVWDPRTGATWAVLTGHAGAVHAVAFAPDGGRLATAGEDGTVRLWVLPVGLVEAARRASDWLPVRVPAVPFYLTRAAVADAGCPQRAVAFRPDGLAVASAGDDGAVRVWRAGGGRTPSAHAVVGGAAAAAAVHGPRSALALEYALRGHAGPVLAVAFAPNGGTIASGSADRTVRLWPADGGPVAVLPGHADAVRAVAFSPDGRTVAAPDNGEDPCVLLWDVARKRIRRRVNGPAGAVYAVTFSPDGQLLAAGGLDAAVRVWEADTGRDLGTLTGHRQAVRGLAFAPDRRLVSASADRTARVWRARAGAADEAPVGPAAAAAFGRGGRILAIADTHGAARVFLVDPAAALGRAPAGTDGRLPVVRFHAAGFSVGTPRAAAVSADDRHAAVAGDHGVVVFDIVPSGAGWTGTEVRVEARRFGEARPVSAVDLSPDGRLLATAEPTGVWVWDAATERAAAGPLLPADGVRQLAFVPGGAARGPVLAVAAGPTVRLVDLSGRVLAEVAHPKGAVTAIAADPTGRLLATADTEGGVRVWDRLPGGGLAERAVTAGHPEAVAALAFTADGRTLASGGRDRTVTLWDPVSGQERATLTGHTDPLVDVAFGAADASMLTVGRDGTLTRWRADPKRPDRLPFPLPQFGATEGAAPTVETSTLPPATAVCPLSP